MPNHNNLLTSIFWMRAQHNFDQTGGEMELQFWYITDAIMFWNINIYQEKSVIWFNQQSLVHHRSKKNREMQEGVLD